MNDNDLERQLRTQAGPREQGYVPRPLPVTSDAAPRRASWSAAARLGLVGATVVAGAALALVLTRPSHPAPSGVGSGGSGPESPSTAPTTTACTSADFAWATDPWGGAAGSRGTNVMLRGVASLDSCRIDGEVSVEIRDANGTELVSGQATNHLKATAGDVFEVGIAWSNWCASDPSQPLTAVLRLPGDETDVPLNSSGGEILVPPCNGPGQATNLSVTEIQPSNRPFPEG